jgi:hypothetical protein
MARFCRDQKNQVPARQTQWYTRRPDTERQPRIPLGPGRRFRSLGPSTLFRASKIIIRVGFHVGDGLEEFLGATWLDARFTAD